MATHWKKPARESKSLHSSGSRKNRKTFRASVNQKAPAARGRGFNLYTVVVYIRFVKRWAAILFLSFFILNFAGIYVYFAFRLIHIKREMRASLKAMPEESLTKLVLTEPEFSKSRVEEHEIKVNGRMYDIARVQFDNGNVTVWCLHDEAEDNLLAFLDAVSNRAHRDSNPVPASIQKFLSLTFLVPVFRFSFLSTVISKSETAYQLRFYSTWLTVHSPPPRF